MVAKNNTAAMARAVIYMIWAALFLPPASSFSYSPFITLPFFRELKSTQQIRSTASDLESSSENPEALTEEVLVALTREVGKNGKLLRALMDHPRIGDAIPVDLEEIPCIQHADGPDTDKLAPTLKDSSFDYVAITSPEAAKVLALAWKEAGEPELGGVVAVGKATEEALIKLGIDVAFVPSKATAKMLVEELPESKDAAEDGRPTTLLYPASAKAKPTLQKGLEGRGFQVTRLDTYDTVPATWSSAQIEKAKIAQVACFASPSAVNAWVENLGRDDCNRKVLAACIGETSAQGCREMGWVETNIFYPEKPGVEGWANAVADALEIIASQN